MKFLKLVWLRRWSIFFSLLGLGLLCAAFAFFTPDSKVAFALSGLTLFVTAATFIGGCLFGFRVLAAWRAFSERSRHANTAIRSDIRLLQNQIEDAQFGSGKTAIPASRPAELKISAVEPLTPPQVISESGEDLEASKVLLQRAHDSLSGIVGKKSEKRLPERSDLLSLTADEPMVSIIIPMFNEVRFVRETIESLKQQTFRNFEAIIVDDAGTDGAMRVAHEATKDDVRFRLVRHAANAGLSAARNTGLRLAKAPLVTFLDSDDMLFPDALSIRIKKIISILESEDAVKIKLLGGSFCRAITVPHSDTYEKAITRKDDRTYYADDVDFVNSAGECPFNPLMPVMFTDIARAVGGFDETFQHGCEDWDFWQRVMRNGYYFATTNRIAAIYRHKRGSMVKAMPREHFEKGTELFQRARREISPYHVVPNAPFVYEKGVQYYEDQKKFAKRTAQYAAICSFISKDAFEEVADSFSPGLAAYVNLQRDILPSVKQGVHRTIALDEVDFAKLKKPATKVIDDVYDALSKRLALPSKSAVLKRPEFDVLLFSQTEVQARVLSGLVEQLVKEGTSAKLITMQTETGDQGDRAYYKDNSIDYGTFNETILQNYSAKVFVIIRPYGSTLRDALPLDAKIIEIEAGNVPSYPDENKPLETAQVVEQDRAASIILDAVKLAKPQRLVETWRKADDHHPVPAPLVMSKEELFNAPPDFNRLVELKDKWRGERCVIIGNGPSINDTDLTLLKDEFTFAVNGIFYKKDQMGFDPTFYVVEDDAVMRENKDAINAFKADYKFFPTEYKHLHGEGDDVFFFLKNRGFYEKSSPAYCIPRFSKDAARRLYCGQSVTHINLQLAYYLGFESVYLIGVDFSYVIPDSAIRRGDLIVSTEDDVNHFHGSYFGKGKTWKDPKLHRVLLNYEISRDMFESDGRKVYNATKGGKLEVFERANYDETFGTNYSGRALNRSV